MTKAEQELQDAAARLRAARTEEFVLFRKYERAKAKSADLRAEHQRKQNLVDLQRTLGRGERL